MKKICEQNRHALRRAHGIEYFVRTDILFAGELIQTGYHKPADGQQNTIHE